MKSWMIAIASIMMFARLAASADPAVDQAWERLRQRQGATTRPVAKAEFDRIVADLQKQVDAMRLQIKQLEDEVAKLKQQPQAGANNGGPAVPIPANPNVANALKRDLIVVGMTRKDMDAVLKRRGVTSIGGLRQSERLIDGKSIRTEIIKLNPDKNYGILPTEIELENDVVVRVEGLHL